MPLVTRTLDAHRRRFLACFTGLGLSCTLLPGVLWAELLAEYQDAQPATITIEMLRDAATVAGLNFTVTELDKLLERVNQNLALYEEMRRLPLDNSLAPPLYFNPVVPGMKIDRTRRLFHIFRAATPSAVKRPRNLEDVAFWPVTHLAELIRTKQVKSIELTKMYLDRLQRYGPKLLCVVTLTEERALAQAWQVDQEIAAGGYRGPLHGIPWGVKDLFATKGYPTTWGAAPFKTRAFNEDATVVSRLDAAGAVLVAKLSTGELAIDDVWFGGQTKNPWDLSMGSQGSSAGPGSATAAGLVGFAMGTETVGSIVEPSGICGVTGMRPTFGRVSRHGVMALSWSLDKVGPMCRSVEDCALVLAAIHGPDDRDLAVQDVPFNWDAGWNVGLDVHKLRVGYLKAAFFDTRQTGQTDANDRNALEKLRALGFTLAEVSLPERPNVNLRLIQWSEATAALKDPVQTEPETLTRQDRVVNLGAARLIPAADYLDANRARSLLMREMARVMSDVDVYVVPFDYADYTPNPVATLNTTITNLTGQPCVVVPHGFNEKGNPTSLTFVGRVFGEASMLAVAKAYQDATEWHLKHPKL
jgi:Asp-tRNA(Asn)/Glu-tRNA(Gln) amidotransferase A subunit family amidase